MVDVVTTAIRSQAQQAQQQVSQQQKQLATQRASLERQRGQLQSAQALRTLSREQRQLQTRQLGSTQQQIQQQTQKLQTTSKELERIRKLPTAQELFSQARERSRADLKVARKAIADKSIAIASLPKSIRAAVGRIRQGQTDAGIIKAAEEQLGQSISAVDRQTILDLSKGITPTEIALKQSLPAGLRTLTPGELPTFQEIKAQQSLLDLRPAQSSQVFRTISEEIQLAKKTPIPKAGLQKRISTKLKDLGVTDKNIKKFTERIFKPIPEVAKIDKKFTPFAERVGLAKFEEKITEKISKPSLEVQKGFVEGAIKGARDEPIKTGLTFATFIAIPPALRGAAALGKLTKITPTLARITPQAIKTLAKVALTKGTLAAYVGATGLEVAQADTARGRGAVIGRKTTTEVIPFFLGSRIGVKGDLKLQLKQEFKKELDKLPADKRAAFEDYIKQSEVLGRFNPTVKNVKFNQVESIPDDAIPTIRKFFKDQKITIGGSAAQTAQLKLDRKAGDIDAYVPEGKDPKALLKQLKSQLDKAGIERVGIGGGGRVLTIKGKKAIDFNNLERLLGNISEVTPFYIPAKNYLVKTPEGIVIQRVGVQLKRKAVAGFVDPKRLATGKFKKDLQDFKSIADQMFKSAELNARRSFIFKETRIKKLEKQFGVKISRAPLKPEKFIKPEKLVKKPSKVSKPKKLGGVGLIKSAPLKKIDISKTPTFKESSLIKADKLKASQKPFTPSQAIPKVTPLKITPSQPFKPTTKPPAIVPSQPFKAPPKKPGVLTPFTPVKSPFTPSQPPKKPSEPLKPFITLTPDERKKRRTAEQKKLKALIFGSEVKPKKLVPPKPRQPGYFTFYKRRGKFIKINKSPLSKRQALDLGSDVADHSLANTFVIKKTKRRAKPAKLLIRSGYFKVTRPKFRDFRIKKGKKIPLKNKFIERRGIARLDTIQERNKIQAERYIKGLRKQKLKRLKPIKLKSTFGGKKKK